MPTPTAGRGCGYARQIPGAGSEVVNPVPDQALEAPAANLAGPNQAPCSR